MEMEKALEKLENKIDDIIDILKGKNGNQKGLCEKQRDIEQEIKYIRLNCKRNHESKIKKYLPVAIQLGMLVVAGLALYLGKN
jgi:hypothetical protein